MRVASEGLLIGKEKALVDWEVQNSVVDMAGCSIYIESCRSHEPQGLVHAVGQFLIPGKRTNTMTALLPANVSKPFIPQRETK